MKLSTDLLAEIMESVTIVGRDEPRAADRRSPRVRMNNHLFAFNWSNPSQPISIRVRDMSDGGVGIFHHERIALDEKMVVRFPRPGDKNVLILGTVVYWEPLAEDLYAIGIQFDRIVSETELTAQKQAGVRPMDQGNVLSRLTQAVSRTWRTAS